jgi:hypothetical protein
LIVDPPVVNDLSNAGGQSVPAVPGPTPATAADTFVFKSNVGEHAGYEHGPDPAQPGSSMALNMAKLLASFDDNGHGDPGTIDAHDATVADNLKALFPAHHGDFHFV